MWKVQAKGAPTWTHPKQTGPRLGLLRGCVSCGWEPESACVGRKEELVDWNAGHWSSSRSGEVTSPGRNPRGSREQQVGWRASETF